MTMREKLAMHVAIEAKDREARRKFLEKEASAGADQEEERR